MTGENLVETPLLAEDLFHLDLDIGRLAKHALAPRLMDHDLGVGQRVALALGTGGEQDRRPRGSHPHAIGNDGALEKLHGVVERQRRRHRSTR